MLTHSLMYMAMKVQSHFLILITVQVSYHPFLFGANSLKNICLICKFCPLSLSVMEAFLKLRHHKGSKFSILLTLLAHHSSQ